jgi:DNA-binding GntR family transcriptional regulator
VFPSCDVTDTGYRDKTARSVERHRVGRQVKASKPVLNPEGRQRQVQRSQEACSRRHAETADFIDKNTNNSCHESFVAVTLVAVSNSSVIHVEEVLAERGLIVATPQCGSRVRQLSVQDIAGLTESRVAIESIALRLAIERGDVRWETEIVAAHHILERTPVLDTDGRFHEPWAGVHRDFHRALTAGCNNARLQGVCLALRDSAELYRRWWWALADDRVRDLASEHRQLKDLTLARDADAAVEALVHHIRRAPDQLIAYAHQHGLNDLNDLNGPPWQAD